MIFGKINKMKILLTILVTIIFISFSDKLKISSALSELFGIMGYNKNVTTKMLERLSIKT